MITAEGLMFAINDIASLSLRAGISEIWYGAWVLAW